jgi:hypothetical protein
MRSGVAWAQAANNNKTRKQVPTKSIRFVVIILPPFGIWMN